VVAQVRKDLSQAAAGEERANDALCPRFLHPALFRRRCAVDLPAYN
jgi:hypothetical protein